MLNVCRSSGEVPEAIKDLPLRLLIVDDSDFDRKWVARMLRQTGLSMDIVEAGSLAAMRLALSGQGFDMTYLDCHLAGSRLDDATDLMNRRKMPGVLITGSDAPALEIRGDTG